jgi:hypothetical protein
MLPASRSRKGDVRTSKFEPMAVTSAGRFRKIQPGHFGRCPAFPGVFAGHLVSNLLLLRNHTTLRQNNHNQRQGPCHINTKNLPEHAQHVLKIYLARPR